MRILFCCTAAEGHFAPLVPLAAAPRAAGHDVAFATGPRFCERVRDAGFDAHPVGMDVDELERRRTALFRLLLDACADADWDVLMTVGHLVDPAELGPLPANATVEQFVPQAEILPRASAVVAHGTPLLLVPQGADRFENAVACAAAGAAIVLPPPGRVVREPAYEESAQRVAAELAAMPTAAEVAGVLFP